MPRYLYHQAFIEFHFDNPHVYVLFDQFTRYMMARGHKRGSAYFLIERVRWETKVETTGEDFKLNNNYRPDYGRYWMEMNPDHGKFFSTRARTREKLIPFPHDTAFLLS